MFIPTKHENLQKSVIVLGSKIIEVLQKKDYNIENLFQELKYRLYTDLSLNQYYNTLTFLWVADIIELDEFFIKIKKNVS